MQEAKRRILESGAGIILEKGFQDAGLAEILKRAGVPKGSFYFYFKNKVDFGLQLIDFFADRLKATSARFYQDENLSPLERLRRLYRWQAESFQRNDFKGGCPIGNLSLEMGDRNPEFRKKLDQVVAELKENLKEMLAQAHKRGEIAESIDIEEAADFIFNSWEGTLMQMKVSKSQAPHQVFDRLVFKKLLTKP
ncbi:MAG: TetR family transcriptional regulator C-terminal domain-containing protein [Thermodesulfobacteriota bacterium]